MKKRTFAQIAIQKRISEKREKENCFQRTPFFLFHSDSLEYSDSEFPYEDYSDEYDQYYDYSDQYSDYSDYSDSLYVDYSDDSGL